MRLLVVSDLHVSGAEDPLYRSLLRWLREIARPGDRCVLAGDVFDLLVGDKSLFRERYADFFSELRAAAERGVELHYIEGNHDFQTEKVLAGIPGLRRHEREVSLELGGRRFFVAHGDTVDRSDLSYLALRFFFRSPVASVLVRSVPGEWIDWIGQRSSRRSRARKPLLANELPIDRRERLRKVYRSFAAEKIAQGYDYVVLGHCHDLDEMSFVVDGRPGQYINVGYPRAHGSYLSWEPGDERIQREKLPV